MLVSLAADGTAFGTAYIDDGLSVPPTPHLDLTFSVQSNSLSIQAQGDYTVTETDVETGRMFDDAIAVGGFAIDVHDPKKEQPEYVNVIYYLIPPVYTIPYRSISAKSSNRHSKASHWARLY